MPLSEAQPASGRHLGSLLIYGYFLRSFSRGGFTPLQGVEGSSEDAETSTFAIFHACVNFFSKMICCLDVPTWMFCRGSEKESCRAFIPWLVLTNSAKPHFSFQPSLGWKAQHSRALPPPVQLLPPLQGPGSVGMKRSGTEVGQGGDGFCCGWNDNV